MHYLNQAINWLTKKVFDTKDKSNSEAIYTLMGKLNLIDYRARNNYMSNLDTAYRKIGIITTPLNKLTKAVTSKGVDILTKTLGDTEAKNINKASKEIKEDITLNIKTIPSMILKRLDSAIDFFITEFKFILEPPYPKLMS